MQSSNKMISISKNPLVVIVRALAVLALNQLLATTIEAHSSEQPLGGPSSSNNIRLINEGAHFAASQQSAALPGHYEFEVAPKMEPPSVRRPPYQQSSTQSCSGPDPFAGFSPRDTLCGNLNEGRVPLNPLGQSINDQAYPFELIKNKTLQFLARALPVLKLEYETIPKVARYLPSQQLLNPTHMGSPLSHQHFHRLNQRLAEGLEAAAANPYLLMSESASGRRRRKRSLAHASYTVAAELAPNASLLVSSAHSAPGRIRDFMGHQAGAEATSALAVITKDGYRPVTHQHPAGSAPSSSSRAPINSTQSSTAAPKPAPPSSESPINNGTGSRQAATSSSPGHNKLGGLETRQQQGAAGGGQPIATPPSSPTGNSQQRNHAKATSADSGQGAAQVALASAVSAARSAGESKQPAPLTNNKQQAPGEGDTGDKQPASHSAGSGLSKRRSLMGCSDSANGFSSAICQAAVALIEGTDRQPVWLQVVKQLGNALAGAADPIAPTPAVANNNNNNNNINPIWSILSGLSSIYAGQNTEAQSKSAGGGQQQHQYSSSRANLMQLIGPISSLLSGGGRSSSNSSSSSDESSHKAADLASAPSTLSSALASSLGGSTMAKLALAGWASNAVAGLLDYFAPALFSSAARGFSRRKSKPYEPLEQFVDTPASLAALTAASVQNPTVQQQQQQQQQQMMARQSQPTGQQLPKQPPTPCPSVEEYISPTFARNYQGTWKYVIQIPHEGYFTQTIQRTSCVRQRCEFTDGVCHESPRWVSLLVAEIYYPHALFSQPAGEQIPAQTLSMLHQQPQQQAPPMSASPSMSNIQQVQPVAAAALRQSQPARPLPTGAAGSISGQDPLQMTDSLNTYNHNLNSAFIEAANGLGLDPNNAANMQQLADAYSYQLMQRNGLLPGQNQMESRSSSASGNPLIGAASHRHYSIQPPINQPLGQQQQPQGQAAPNPNAHNDYILSLAKAALEQNPHLGINDLIASIQHSLSRNKRDLFRSSANPWSPQQQQQPQQQSQLQQPQQTGHRIQQRSSTGAISQPLDQSTNHPAINEIPSAGQPNNQSPFGKGSSSDSSIQQNHAESQANSASASASASSSSGGQSGGDATALDQTECDGHDKIGCYVVRVYYDWFLVNGSCKCWKTTGGQQQSGQQSGNSFLRRIFTG